MNTDKKVQIYCIRNQQVIFDFDLAKLYGYSTKAFNQHIKRNIEIFDDSSMFQITKNELKNILRSQIVTANEALVSRRSLPFVLTKNGVIRLSTIMKNKANITQLILQSFNNELVLISENDTEYNIKDIIYSIRGQKVILDSDLAAIYGYDTKRLNEQVQNNIEKFPERYRFQLNNDEVETISRSKKSTAIPLMQTKGIKGGRTTFPLVFTEQGIYMLMTVLKGELATKQSIALIDAFKQMKDYIVETNNGLLLNTNPYIESKFVSYDKRFETIENKLDVVMDNFIDPSSLKHFIILNGERIEADVAYQSIYQLAKESIIIIDDYINLKTLELLKVCNKNISITICSDNVSKNGLTSSELDDFIKDTGINIQIVPTNNIVHDRYILIDYKKENEIMYFSGSSSKDSGKRITTIMQIEKPYLYHQIIKKILRNS